MASLTRVTQGTISQATIEGLQAALGRVQRQQEKLATGKEISRPSDDPGGTVAALTYRSDIRRSEQYSRNSQNGLDWLGTADSTMSGMMTMVQRARDLTLQGANASMSADERNAIAAEMDTLRQGLIGMANTTYLDRPIFGGTAGNATGTTVAYDANGNYQGDNGQVLRNVAPGVQVAVNVNGPQVFGTGATGLFNALNQISADLRSNNAPALTQTDLGNLDVAMTQLQNTHAVVGARYDRVQSMKTLAENTMLNLKNGLSSVEDADLPKTITDLQLQQVSYQAALAATAKVIQPSLVDFLR
jgi:flagellar hook-associated protein 3 FlgL